MSIQIVSGFKEHFLDLVEQASEQLKVKPLPVVRDYIVDVLEYHVLTAHLFPKQNTTLAELWLEAQNSKDTIQQRERLKALGDKALYVSGYFSESLQRKIVDVDYYMQMGELAFGHLSDLSKTETQGRVYRILSEKFPSWVEIIHFVAIKSFPNSDSGVLRLYEQYLKTGSELARTQLVERGVVALSQDQLKKANQDD
jgi:hypothetical protein